MQLISQLVQFAVEKFYHKVSSNMFSGECQWKRSVSYHNNYDYYGIFLTVLN